MSVDLRTKKDIVNGTLTCFLVWTRRPIDGHAWPIAYLDRTRAENAEYRVSDITEVVCQEHDPINKPEKFKNT